jgi:hypothetical protein
MARLSIVVLSTSNGHGPDLSEYTNGNNTGIRAVIEDIDAFVSQINSDIEDAVFQLSKAQEKLNRSSRAMYQDRDKP